MVANSCIQCPIAPIQLQQGTKGDPPGSVPYYPSFLRATHSSPPVVNKPTPTRSSQFPVSVRNGSDGKVVQLLIKSSDTSDKLQKKCLEQRPDLTGGLNIAYNGKPILQHQTMGELGVKAGATFITFQRCPGG